MLDFKKEWFYYKWQSNLVIFFKNNLLVSLTTILTNFDSVDCKIWPKVWAVNFFRAGLELPINVTGTRFKNAGAEIGDFAQLQAFFEKCATSNSEAATT